MDDQRDRLTDLPKEFDLPAIEERCRELWEEARIYQYDPGSAAEVYAVDTPPPYVSAAHLHVGHAMSYAQAEFIVRYQRMNGKSVFYPMGFDDNGLPTERFVERTYGINKQKTTRSEFRRLCLEETRKGAAHYEKLWRALGLSVDWRLRYSTIDDHCRATSQKSFLDLYRKERMRRSVEPVLWDTHFETALAQADLDTLERNGALHDVAFRGTDGTELVISTTRPELIPACVALYCNPADDRYRRLAGSTAVVPLLGYEVPLRSDDGVDMEFGTGLMMVCTFGDGEDVKRWKRDGLDTRLCIGPNGRMLPLAGAYAGLAVEQARSAILADLQAAGAHRGSRSIKQTVSISERSGAPVEFVMAPQWFIRLLDLKEELLARSAQLLWYPAWMKSRLDQWIEGLKYDWNISRQRFYGVPFPVWYCASCEAVVLADEASLPVDPLEDAPPVQVCPACGGKEFRGEADVMDTWMTSSLTPLINANWAGTPGRIGDTSLLPLTVRVQAFEIIRTWLFYTLAKSHLHCDDLPWTSVMISGWGLNEQGKKISKRDLEPSGGKSAPSRYDPYWVIDQYGADSLRYWAAGSHLGHDTRFNEKDVKAGRKLVTKLWNAARFVLMQLPGFDPAVPFPPFAERTPEDRWVLAELNRILPVVKQGFESYDYAVAREATDRFFWATFCDDYLEIIKDRFWNPDRYSASSRSSAQATMWECLRTILALYAPFIPFITEELYQRIYRPAEGTVSLHVTSWPAFDPARSAEIPEMAVVMALLRTARSLRTTRQISQTRPVAAIVLDVAAERADLAGIIHSMKNSIQAAARAAEIRFGEAASASELEGVRLDLIP